MTKKEKETLRKLIAEAEDKSIEAIRHTDLGRHTGREREAQQHIAKAFTELYKFAGVGE
jgi:ABC-type Fe2+-enterobactin transport system substrate-binding protein